MKNRTNQNTFAESEGTGIYQLTLWKKMATALLLTISFHSITCANTLIIFSEENQSYSGVLQTVNETAKVVAIVNNDTLIGLTDVSIAAVSDGSGVTDAVSDGSGFTDAVSDGSGFTDAVSDGSGLVFTLDQNDCKLMHIETDNGIISIRLNQVVLNKQEVNCG